MQNYQNIVRVWTDVRCLYFTNLHVPIYDNRLLRKAFESMTEDVI